MADGTEFLLREPNSSGVKPAPPSSPAWGHGPATLCPHCGYDLVEDRRLEVDGYTLDPSGTISWNGKALHFSRFEARFLYALAKAEGRVLGRQAILSRLGSTGKPEVITVLVHRMREELKRAGAPNIIQIVRGRGYRWELD